MATVDVETLQRLSMLRLRNKLMHSYEQQLEDVPETRDPQVESVSDYVLDSSFGYFSLLSEKVTTDDEVKKELKNSEMEFIDYLLTSDFETEYENDATAFVERYIVKHREAFLNWMLEFFMHYQDNPQIVIPLLELFRCYDYSFFNEQAGAISEMCIHNKSLEVQDVNLSLLGHWCDINAKRIMDAVEEPTDPWMRMKYKRIKEIIDGRCTT